MKRLAISNLIILLTVPALAIARGKYVEQSRYAPNEILVKLCQPVPNTAEEWVQFKHTSGTLKLPKRLDELNAKHRITMIEPLFKDFKQKSQQIEDLLKKDKSLLAEKQRHMLRRLKRAPQDLRVPDLSRIYKIEFDLEPNQPIEKVLREYQRNPDVEYAELNYIVSICKTPNDSLYSVQWPLNNTGQMYPESGRYNHPPGIPDADGDAPEAWNIHTGNPDVIVAVVDTGIDYNHRDIVNNLWTDPNGYHGYNFLNSDLCYWPLDDHGHGTHCAGIIAAKGNNALDIAGICWNAKIMALKFVDQNGSGSYDNAAQAFYYAVDNGADIISNSWGGNDFSQTMQDAINYAYSQGVLIVAAAGNDTQYYYPHYPSSMEHVISVAATNSKDEKAPFSNYGDRIDIFAPGVDVLSLRAYRTSIGTPYDAYTTIASGTSMACPYVAGVLALLLSEYPEISCEEITARLLDNADDISAANPDYIGQLGDGRVNAYKSIRFNSEAVIEFDRSAYSCDDMIEIEIRDFDVRRTGTREITLTTIDGDSETVTLTEEPNHPWIFQGTIPTASGAANQNDALLEVSDGTVITAAYLDPNFGDNGAQIVTQTVYADCVQPVISDIEIHNVTSSGAMVKFKTNEPTTGRVLCGLTCAEPYNICGEDETLGVIHDVYISGLHSQTVYYFVVDANDASGNHTADTNSGQCYTFSTQAKPEGLHVPGEYPTIQSAINNAVNGDTIWVADGIYTGPGNYNIDFLGKSITLRSENGAKYCIINAQNSGRGFYFRNNETLQSVLDGFTITGGWAEDEGEDFSNGGGIYCLDCGPTIRNCIISGNNAETGVGGGIAGGNPSIINCIIENNRASSSGGIRGGSVVVSNCVISGNVATYDYGGGICCWQDSYPIIENCLIKNNASWNVNRGGGMAFGLSYPTVRNCLFIDNFAMGDYYGGGAIHVSHSKATIENCTFYGNRSAVNGGACYLGGNKDIYVRNCIFFNNYPDQIYELMTTGQVYVSYSDVENGYSGTGNINSDPQFADASNDDFHLKSQAGRWEPSGTSWVYDSISSPCIDTGEPSSDWTNELWPHGKRVNMGVYGNTPQASLSNSSVGNIADLNLDGLVDFLDLQYLTDDWLNEQILIPSDLDRSGNVNLMDYAVFSENWLREE